MAYEILKTGEPLQRIFYYYLIGRSRLSTQRFRAGSRCNGDAPMARRTIYGKHNTTAPIHILMGCRCIQRFISSKQRTSILLSVKQLKPTSMEDPGLLYSKYQPYPTAISASLWSDHAQPPCWPFRGSPLYNSSMQHIRVNMKNLCIPT